MQRGWDMDWWGGGGWKLKVDRGLQGFWGNFAYTSDLASAGMKRNGRDGDLQTDPEGGGGYPVPAPIRSSDAQRFRRGP